MGSFSTRVLDNLRSAAKSSLFIVRLMGGLNVYGHMNGEIGLKPLDRARRSKCEAIETPAVTSVVATARVWICWGYLLVGRLSCAHKGTRRLPYAGCNVLLESDTQISLR